MVNFRHLVQVVRSRKMGLRWWRDVLILSQPKRYLDDRQACNTGSYRFVRLGNGPITGLKIRCPKGRAGSTPALGTNDFISSLELII